jgi:hypothetical protein
MKKYLVEISVGIYTNKRYCKTIEAVYEFIDICCFLDFPSDVVMAMKPELIYFADSNQEEVTIHIFLKGLSFLIPINIKKIED